MTERGVTLRDVAAHAGVSPRTVSNVVNDFAHVSPAMRAKVQASLEELKYRPNLLARSLRKGRTGLVTLLVPDLTAAYFAELAHEIVEEAAVLGMTVLVDETGGERARERALLETAAESSWVDGVLLSSLGLSASDLAGLGSRTSVVLLGERTAGSALDHVGIDNVAAASDAVAHLLETGRTRITALGGRGSPVDATSRLRLRGYTQALRAAGLADQVRHARTPDYRRDGARTVVNGLLAGRDRPDALFCFSDDLAHGALRAAHELGLRVPDDLAVVGFDDVEISRFTVPSLTTVRPDRGEIARRALAMLVQRLDDPGAKPRDVTVRHEVVVRESSAPLR